MKLNMRILLPVIWVLLLLLTASLPSAEATDPSVTLGRWINYGAGTFNFPTGHPITALAVDSQERLWIGTAGGGIAAFDGAFWTRYTTADGLVNDNVLAVAPRGNGVLIGTQAGISLFDTTTNTWTTYTGGLPSTTIHAIAFGGPLVTWIFATPAGLAECSPIFPAGLSCAVRTTANSDLADNWVWDVAVGQSGTRWIVTDGGVNRVAGNTWTTYTNANTPGCGVIESARRVAIDAARGRVWFGTDRSGIDSLPGQGACMFDTASGTWHRFHTGNSGLSNDTVKDLAVDGVGRVWLGTAAGGVSVCTWVDDTCYWQSYRAADGLASDRVRSVGVSRDRVWFGTSDAGLSSFALHWQFFNEPVLTLASQPGRLWVGSNGGIRRFDGAAWVAELPGQEVRAILPVAADEVWAGTDGSGIFRWNGSTWQAFDTGNSGLASNSVLALARDAMGRLWMGTNGAGVSVYDPAAEGWTTFHTGNSPLASGLVQALAVDPVGHVWIGTSNGLNRYTGTTWETYTTADGLPDNDIQALAVDPLGEVWVATFAGAARWDGTGWTVYTTADGLPSDAVRAVSVDPTGQVWLATGAGAAVFDGSSWTVYRARNSGLTNERVSAITTDADGGVWFGAAPLFAGPVFVAGGLFVRGTRSEPLGQPAPTITDFSPASGVWQTEVTITGTHFDPRGPGYNTVEFQAKGFNRWVTAPVLGVDGTTTLTTSVPPTAVQGPIRVRTAVGTATSSSNFDPLPIITSLNPIAGVVGAPVDIYGRNLVGPGFPELRFGDSDWNSLIVTEFDPLHIRAYVPQDATTGRVHVRNASGTVVSSTDFTIGSGGLVLFDWEVHQGLPSYPLVAGKSTVVRVFVGTDDPAGLCAYVDRAVLQVLPSDSDTPRSYLANLDNGGVPNDGWFCNVDKQVTSDGSIDFVIPGADLSAGRYLLGVGLSARWVNLLTRELGWYQFTETGDLRIHASVPGLPAATAVQLGLLQGQLTALARTFPLRDGWGDLGSRNGVQVHLRPYQVCDGTPMPNCGTGYEWDFWQQNPAGQIRARTRKNELGDATDNGGQITWHLGTVKQGQKDTQRFMVRLRPATTFPVGTTVITVTARVDSSDQPGSPDAMISVPVTVNPPVLQAQRVGDATNPGIEEHRVKKANHAAAATAGPDLVFLSATVNRIFDYDSSGDTSPGDVIEYSFRYENQGDADAGNTTLVIDYDESHMAIYGSGKLMLGNVDTFETELIPGQFFVGGGGLDPLDENYDGVIDEQDLPFFVVEFDDWNPDTGDITVSTDLFRLDPGEIIRSRSGGIEAPIVRRKANKDAVIWNTPLDFMNDYNKSAADEAEFSALWFLEGINPFWGPGTAKMPGIQSWANADDTTALAQELGHNTGQVKKASPNNDGGSHSMNARVPGIPAAYDIVGRRVVTQVQTRSIMNAAHPLENGFFEPFEYFELFKFFRQRVSAATQVAALPQALGDPLFYISGLVTKEDEVRIANSYLAGGLSPTSPDETSSYQLRFLAGGEVVGEHRFPVNFQEFDLDDHHRLVEAATAPFSIIQPFPTGTTAVEVVHGADTLARLEVSPTPPQVRVLTPNGGERFKGREELLVRWQASDADGDPLSFAVRYSADDGATWQTLSPAARGNELRVSLGTLPGSDEVRIEVEASDGFHTARDRSDAPFRVGKKPPLWAGILAPSDGERLVQSQLVTLSGAGYDLEDGALSGAALVWSSDRGGVLGRGETITTTLAVGSHLLTLEATDSDGQTNRGTVSVQVLADFDGDGLSDEYEQGQGVLDWWNPADAGADPDRDGLTNRGEAAWGTDPANPDSDGDGVLDGVEAREGSLPGDPERRPQAPQLRISQTELRFSAPEGGPNPPSQALLLISSTPAELTWTADADATWLRVAPASGTTPTEVMVGVDVAGLAPGVHEGRVTFRGGGGERVLPVRLEVVGGPTQTYTVYLPLVGR